MIKSYSEIDQVKEMTEIALQSVTSEMVSNLTVKLVSMMEILDEMMQPETLSLLHKLSEVSESLNRSLDIVQTLEQSGSLKTLSEFAELVSSMKGSMTNQMISESVEKVIGGVEYADGLVQNGALELVEGIVGAFDKAQEERHNQPPITRYQLLCSIGDPDVREGMGLLISFLKALPHELKKA